MRAVAWVACLGLVSACRTEIKPLVRQEPVARKVRVAPGECSVHDFPTGSDVPAGSQNIGWVKIPRQETDEATFEKLRQLVCDKGGDGLSQLHWLRASGASVAEPPQELEGNAWILP